MIYLTSYRLSCLFSGDLGRPWSVIVRTLPLNRIHQLNSINILLPTTQKQLMEFAPLDFFPTFSTPTRGPSDLVSEFQLAKDDIESSVSTFHDEDNLSVSDHSESSKKSFKPCSSENHNMVKQLIITIKQMVGDNIQDVGCSFKSREIILATWKLFEKTKNPSK